MTRQELEKRVLRKVAGNIFKAGLRIRVTCNDGEEVGATEYHTKLNDEFVRDSMCSDLIEWEVYSGDLLKSSVLLVFGNDGYDLIANHGVSMTEYMPTDEEMDRYEKYAESIRN